jgi:hypothetical protein
VRTPRPKEAILKAYDPGSPSVIQAIEENSADFLMALGRAAGASVTIRNTGNRGIPIPQDTEYETPVTLDSGKGAEIIGSLRITK